MKKIRRQVQMLRAKYVLQVQVFVAHLRHRSWIREDIALRAVRQNYGDAGLLFLKLAHAGKICAARAQLLQTHLGECVVANRGAEANDAAQAGQIVGDNCRRTAERHGEVGREIFAVALQRRRQPAQNQVQV